MSDNQLRSKLIRLASSNPSLRKDLLPLLKQAADEDSEDWVASQLTEMGKAFEDLSKKAASASDEIESKETMGSACRGLKRALEDLEGFDWYEAFQDL